MINMISLSTIDSFGMPNPSSGDPADTDVLNDMFAMLLTVPVSAPLPPVLPMTDAPDTAPVQTGGALVTVDPGGGSPEIANYIGPAISLIGETAADTKNCVTAALVKPKADGFAIPDFLLPADSGVEKMPLDSDVLTSVRGEKPLPLPPFSNEPLPSVVGAQPDAPLKPQTSQDPSSLPSSAPPEMLNESQVLMKAIPSPDEATLPMRQPKESATIPQDTRTDLRPDIIPETEGNITVLVASKPAPRPMPLDPRGPDAVHPKQIIVELPVQTADRSIFAFSAVGPSFSGGLKQVFKDVSSSVRSGDVSKTGAAAELLPEENIVPPINQNLMSDAGQAFSQSLPEEPKVYKDSEKPAGTVTDAVFSASLSDAVKGPPVVEKAPVEQVLSPRIIEQVEPHVAALAAIVQNVGERRVLKMRLTPPELGTVEITLQKSPSGRIDAHFKTDNQDAKQVLADSLGQLRESLERSGMHVGDLDTSCSLFSATGNDGRRQQPNSSGTSGPQPGGITNFDGISEDDGDDGDRLVNLRA